MDYFRRNYDTLKKTPQTEDDNQTAKQADNRTRAKGLSQYIDFSKEKEDPAHPRLDEKWLEGWMRESLCDLNDVEVIKARTIQGKASCVTYGGLIVRGRRLKLEPFFVGEEELESFARLIVMERGEGLAGSAENFMRMEVRCDDGKWHEFRYGEGRASGPIASAVDLRREVLHFAANRRFDTPKGSFTLHEGDGGFVEVSLSNDNIFPEKDVMQATFEKLAATSAFDLPKLDVIGRTEHDIVEQIVVKGLGIDDMRGIMEDYEKRTSPASLANLMRRHFLVWERTAETSIKQNHLKVSDLKPYFTDGESAPHKERVLETEISKEGLRRFHEETGMYLVLTLMDSKSASSFDMEGTWPSAAEDWPGPRWDETGIFSWERPRREDEDDIVYVLADIPNLFDAINFFEAERSFADMLAEGSEGDGLEVTRRAPIGFDFDLREFVYLLPQLHDPLDDPDEDLNLLARPYLWSVEQFIGLCEVIMEWEDCQMKREETNIQ